jgi:hypothetical protein
LCRKSDQVCEPPSLNTESDDLDCVVAHSRPRRRRQGRESNYPPLGSATPRRSPRERKRARRAATVRRHKGEGIARIQRNGGASVRDGAVNWQQAGLSWQLNPRRDGRERGWVRLGSARSGLSRVSGRSYLGKDGRCYPEGARTAIAGAAVTTLAVAQTTPARSAQWAPTGNMRSRTPFLQVGEPPSGHRGGNDYESYWVKSGLQQPRNSPGTLPSAPVIPARMN